MTELDGVWRVRRVSGLLPPLVGVRKRIRGSSGETAVGPLPGVPFDVVGLSLRYRAPFQGFVDELEPTTDGFLRRATFRGAPPSAAAFSGGSSSNRFPKVAACDG